MVPVIRAEPGRKLPNTHSTAEMLLLLSWCWRGEEAVAISFNDVHLPAPFLLGQPRVQLAVGAVQVGVANPLLGNPLCSSVESLAEWVRGVRRADSCTLTLFRRDTLYFWAKILAFYLVPSKSFPTSVYFIGVTWSYFNSVMSSFITFKCCPIWKRWKIRRIGKVRDSMGNS